NKKILKVDGKKFYHIENTIAITETGFDILTKV
ncbi:type I methionyl aminopeptidase, partial [Bacillus velezensis]